MPEMVEKWRAEKETTLKRQRRAIRKTKRAATRKRHAALKMEIATMEGEIAAKIVKSDVMKVSGEGSPAVKTETPPPKGPVWWVPFDHVAYRKFMNALMSGVVQAKTS